MPPSPEHEALHRVFQYDRKLFARSISRVLGVLMPEPSDVQVLTVDLTETRPLERRADSVLLVQFNDGKPAKQCILLVESQTESDEVRRRRWPYYIAFLQDKYECPVLLLVVCSKQETTEWARKPITIGLAGLTCMRVTPLVLGPDNVPAVTSLAEAADDIPFAVFSALTHSRGPEAHAILEALAAALDTIDTETADFLVEFTEAGLGNTPGQRIWKVLMATVTYPYVSELRSKGREEGRQEGRQEGRAQGQAQSILQVLDRRGIAVDDGSRERIESCIDADTLSTWLDRALTATKATDLFD
ncbi:MAG TPA: hypothetical protein VHZ03_47920 [Trebonia sp.]|nr:hypothetical protein [Trebonia sp.]